MDRDQILQQVLNSKVKDYSYPVLFFIIFSVFLYFAIRPNLVTAFSLQQELDQLRLQDAKYESVILNIVRYQSLIEQTRGDFPLLEDAVPQSPSIFAIVRDIRAAATMSGMTINELEIGQVRLKAAPDEAENTQKADEAGRRFYTIRFTAPSNFYDTRSFITRLIAQRRLKTVESIKVNIAQEMGTSSATFNFAFEVKGYYL